MLVTRIQRKKGGGRSVTSNQSLVSGASFSRVVDHAALGKWKRLV